MNYIIAVQLALFILIVVNIFLTLKLRMGNNVATSEDIARIDNLIRDEFCRNREELNNSFKNFSEILTGNIDKLSNAQQIQFKNFSEQLLYLVKNFDDRTITIQNQFEKLNKENRIAQTDSLKSFEEKFTFSVKEFNNLQKQKFDELVSKQENIKKDTELKLKEIRDTVENKLKTLQDENVKKLEEMRKTVDEKLQETVEKRFTESFKLISTRLEAVHKGLGEMQTLASGVGNLQKVLSGVKTRGNLGEMQLGAILYQILSPQQYKQNVQIKKGSQERVEYAIELPGRSNDNKPLLLPIDSKFPIVDYQKLLDCYDDIANKNPKDVEDISKKFESSIKKSAGLICEKYINPPDTTDFAIMFVPSEGLYAEIVRRTELFETLRHNFKITVVGPTNLVAFLSSLQMGFKTLAIEKRSSEVWATLATVKTGFSKFGGLLNKTKKKLQEAANDIDQAVEERAKIEKKLTTVEQLP
ncbi:DNA recombination protein RmuC [Deltaproteobacteria bacterium]|nr:DNA recombination protein RmuC [Deltaproteobacteria bacterium]